MTLDCGEHESLHCHGRNRGKRCLFSVHPEHKQEQKRSHAMLQEVYVDTRTLTSEPRKQKNFLLVRTANGNLAIFEDKAVKKCKGAAPLKTLSLGDTNTPLTCLSESTNSSEKRVMRGGCDIKVFSFSNDFSIQKLIETRTNQLLSYAAFSDSNIIVVAVDTTLYVAKKNSPVVEV